jgi:hypothetical protein
VLLVTVMVMVKPREQETVFLLGAEGRSQLHVFQNE